MRKRCVALFRQAVTLTGIVLTALCAATARAEVTIREEQDAAARLGITLPDSDSAVEEKYDRFPQGGPTNPAFFGIKQDWSGVGRAVSNPKWGTLVAGQFYVSAWHARPALQVPLRFYTGPDPTNAKMRVDVKPVAHQQLKFDYSGNGRTVGTDVMVGRLNQSVPANVAVYPLYLPNIPGSSPYAGKELVMFGHSAASNTVPCGKDKRIYEDGSPLSIADPRSQKIGTNTAVPEPGSPQPSGVNYLFDELDNPREFMARHASSGAPSLYLWQDMYPTLVGVHRSVILGRIPSCALDQRIPDNGPGTPVFGNDRTVALYRRELDEFMQKQQQDLPPHERQVLVFRTDLDGDYNGNHVLDGGDLDIMTRERRLWDERRPRGYNWYLDWNHDRRIDAADEDHLIQVVCRTRRGDVDVDGDVDESDQRALRRCLGRSGTGWSQGDLNGDGRTDQVDLRILLANQQ